MKDLNDEVNVTFKLYPTRYKNNRGFYLGKYSIALESVNSPTGLLTEVDFYLNALFKNLINDMKPGNDKTREHPNNIIPFTTNKIKFAPVRYKKSGKLRALIGGKTRAKIIKNKKNITQRKLIK